MCIRDRNSNYPDHRDIRTIFAQGQRNSHLDVRCIDDVCNPRKSTISEFKQFLRALSGLRRSFERKSNLKNWKCFKSQFLNFSLRNIENFTKIASHRICHHQSMTPPSCDLDLDLKSHPNPSSLFPTFWISFPIKPSFFVKSRIMIQISWSSSLFAWIFENFLKTSIPSVFLFFIYKSRTLR